MKNRVVLYLFFAAFLCAHVALAFATQDKRALWLNVPPVPAKEYAALFSLGDRQLSYRMTGVMLQNLGNVGGESRYLGDYNYERLGQWFAVADYLDPRSDFVPLLAAYYFGALPEGGERLTPVVDYLAEVGQRPEGEKWRWLGQAVYIARFQQGDLNKALSLSEMLASQWKPGRPAWTKQMPVFITLADGDKKAAYEMMMTILKEEGDQMHPNEVNFMVEYICTRILNQVQASTHPLCQSKDL